MKRRASYKLLTLGLLTAVLVGLSAATIDRLRYSEFEKERYLTDEQIAFVRPGLQLTMTDVNVAADRTVSVTFRITDDRGLPLDRAGVFTPGPVATSFILAHIPAGETQYVAYTTRQVTSPITNVTAVQASADTGGSYAQVGDGTYRYTFGRKPPENYDRNTTHSIGVYATRNLAEFNLSRGVANEVVHFIPAGGPVQTVRDVAANQACRNCHNPSMPDGAVEAHGGARQKMELCVMCHTPQTIDPDTGHTQDMPVLTHKIHMGHELPSVQAGTPYVIIGHNQSVHDYSDVAFPQDIRNCQSCHTEDAVQHEAFLLRPSRAACGSCHDHVNFASGANHANGLPQISDRFCGFCHFPEGEMEFDASIQGAHTVPLKSQQKQGVNIEILSVANTGPGQNPVVHFQIRTDDGEAIAPGDLNSFSFVLAGPVTDYRTAISESAAADSTPLADGWSYTFKAPIPADATGTFAVVPAGYRNVVLNPGTVKAMTVRDAARNPVHYVAVTDSAPQPRRQVVSTEKCESCHDILTFHGDQRFGNDFCVTCHNPEALDTRRRPADQMPAGSIDMKLMIHRIHMGEDLERDYTLYGFGNVAHNYNHVRYPGDPRVCTECHVGNSFQVPSQGVLATVAPRELFSPIQPNSAACMGCHDSVAAAAHAFLNTAPFGEACAACHGPNSQFSVTRVHAR
jgi:OmcA/MtrC family decaheme c-type cytochrome